jgi:predicted nucleotidyltransferase
VIKDREQSRPFGFAAGPLEKHGAKPYSWRMDKDAVIAVLRSHRTELEKLGVRHVALFGSMARGDAGPNSDIDISIELDEDALPDVYAYVGLKDHVAALFPGRVDVVNRAFLRPRVRDNAAADLIYAF